MMSTWQVNGIPIYSEQHKKNTTNTPNIYMEKDYRKVPFPKQIFARYGEEKAIDPISLYNFVPILQPKIYLLK